MSPQFPSPAAPTGKSSSLVKPSSNNSAPIIIVTILSFIFAFLVFSLRVFIVKWKKHGLDDVLLGVGHLIAVGHWSAMFIAIKNGLGKAVISVEDGDLHRMAMALLASRILLMLILCFSKLSFLIILRSLFYWESKAKTIIIDATIFITAAWGIAASLALSIACSPNYIFDETGTQCKNQVLRLTTVMTIEIMTDFAIFAIPGIFLCTFDIQLQKKLLAILTFSCRLLLPILSTFYLLANIHFFTAPKTGLTIIPSLVFQEILVAYSLISATIPSLRAFVASFTTTGVRYNLELQETRRENQLSNVEVQGRICC